MKRRLLQIHLLTALAGMVCAGIFIGLNLTVFHVEVVRVDPVSGSDLARLFVWRHSYLGWPMEACDPTQPFVISWSEIEDVELPPAVIPTVLIDRVEKIKKSTRVLGEPVVTLEDIRRQDPSLEKDVVYEMQFKTEFPTQDANWYWKNVAINTAVAVAATLAVMFGLEILLRRRERAKV